MDFHDSNQPIHWHIHLTSAPLKVYQALATDAGRASFWAESAVEQAGYIDFRFPNEASWRGKILIQQPPRRLSIKYYGGSITTFSLQDDGQGGTHLELSDEGVPASYRTEVIAGWVSILMALKAAVDFGVDLRNHDQHRTWETGFADN